jgi:VWFA-related protein
MDFQGVTWRIFAIAVLGAPLCLGQPEAQQNQNAQNAAELTQQDTPLTFTTGANLVLVPVVVRDGTGHAIGTLTKDDFQLFDKGKPVVIAKFSVEKAETPPILPDTSIETDANGNPQGKRAGPAGQPVASHFILWLFDDIHLSFDDLSRTREAAKKLLKDSFEPGTRAAIYTTSNHTSLDFTDDAAKLSATLDEIKPWPTIPTDGATRPCPDIGYFQADRIINAGDQQALTAAEASFMNCPEAIPFTQALQEAMRQPGTTLQTVPVPPQLLQLVRMDTLKELEVGNQDTRNVLLVLKQLIRRMSAMPGSRTIVLVSPGFYLVDAHRTDETDVINNAIRNNVVLSSLDARGVYTVTPGGKAGDAPRNTDPGTQALLEQYDHQQELANQDILQELAGDTGGTFFHNSNDFYGGLKLVATQPEYIYVLGFAPQNLKFDGSYHNLKVVLKTKTANQTEARRGYFERRHLENAAEEAKEELKEVFFSREEMSELPVEMSTRYFKTSQDKAKLSILARIDAKHLHYRKADGRNADQLTVVGGVFDRNGNFVAGTQKVVNLKLKDQTLDALPASGITVKTDLDVASGDYVVRLVVRDSEGQSTSALTNAVIIP